MKRICECGSEVPPGKRKFCSEKCSNKAHNRYIKSMRLKKKVGGESFVVLNCLQCGQPFKSVDKCRNRRCYRCVHLPVSGVKEFSVQF